MEADKRWLVTGTNRRNMSIWGLPGGEKRKWYSKEGTVRCTLQVLAVSPFASGPSLAGNTAQLGLSFPRQKLP